jgi:plastocyanin
MKAKLKIKRSVQANSSNISAYAIAVLVILGASIIAVSLLKGPASPVVSETGVDVLKAMEAVRIQGVAQNTTSGTLIVYVKNVGEGIISLSECSLYVNDVKIPLLPSAIDKNSLAGGETATIQVPYLVSPERELKVRIVTSWGTLNEVIMGPNSLPSAYTLVVNTQADGDGWVSRDPDQSSYASGTTVALKANPQAGWSFQGWDGDLKGSDNPATIVVDANKVVNASFTRIVSVSSSEEESVVSGSQGSVPPQNVEPSSPNSASPQEAQVTFAQFGLDGSAVGAVVTINGSAKMGSELPFSLTVKVGDVVDYSYVDSVSSNVPGVQFRVAGVVGPSSPIAVAGDAIVNGSYRAECEVNFTSSPDIANVTMSPVGVRWVASGEAVVINATAGSPDFVFCFWSASSQSITFADKLASSTTAVIGGPGVVTANFKMPTRMDWYTQPSNISLGSVENVSGILYNPSTGWSTKALNDKSVRLIITAPNSTQILVPLTTHSAPANGSIGGVFDYQFKPDAAGAWTASAQFDEDATFLGSVLSPASFNVSAKPRYRVAFGQSGADGAAAAPTVTYQVDAGPNATGTVPFSVEVDQGSRVSFVFNASVAGAVDTRYVFVNANASSPRTVSSSVTIIGNYKTQYYLAVNSPLGTNPTGQGWYDSGSTASSSVSSTVTIAGPPKIYYTSLGYVGTGSAGNGTGTSVKFAVNSPSSVTWKWHGQLTLYPDGDGSISIPHFKGTGGHWQCVSDAGNSDDAAYVYAGSGDGEGWFTDYYSVQDHGSASGTINNVTVYNRCMRGSGSSNAYGRTYLRLGGNNITGASYTLSSRWTDYSNVLSRPGGGSWSWDDVDKLYCGVSLSSGSTREARCTLVWVVVDFTT